MKSTLISVMWPHWTWTHKYEELPMTLRIGLVGREGIVQIAAFCLAIILFVAPARAEDAAHAASRLAGAAAHAMQLADASKDPILSRDYRLGPSRLNWLLATKARAPRLSA